MTLTTYQKAGMEDTMVNCVLAMKNIREQIELESSAYNTRIAGLKDRLSECQETIDRLTEQLAAV